MLTKSPDAIHSRHRARTGRPCDTGSMPCEHDGCTGWIEPGEMYVRSALPPHSDIGNPGWWTLRAHAENYPPDAQEGRKT